MGVRPPNAFPYQLGQFQVLTQIAQGGMADVFLGRVHGEAGFEKLVAIKQVRARHLTEHGAIQMFIDEARISAQLQHGNIGHVIDFGRDGEDYYIAMEYIHGLDLNAILKLLAARKLLPPVEMAAYVVGNVCAALDYAHARRDREGRPLGIIHRDVTPSNVLISYEGEVKLIDFGIARAAQRLHVTDVLIIKGKFAYMSPEQAAGRDLDRRTDIYTAGLVLYELLVGHKAIRGETDLDMLEKARAGSFPPPHVSNPRVPHVLEAICMRALQRSVRKRYGSASEMQAELEAFCFHSAYGRRQLAEWMQESFVAEAKEQDDLLARLRGVVDPQVHHAETVELNTEEMQPTRETDLPTSPAAITLERPEGALAPTGTESALTHLAAPAEQAGTISVPRPFAARLTSGTGSRWARWRVLLVVGFVSTTAVLLTVLLVVLFPDGQPAASQKIWVVPRGPARQLPVDAGPADARQAIETTPALDLERPAGADSVARRSGAMGAPQSSEPRPGNRVRVISVPVKPRAKKRSASEDAEW